MAQENRKIKHDDLIENGVFSPAQKDAEKFYTTIIDIKTGFKELLTESKAFMQANPFRSSKDISDYNKQILQVQKAEKGLLAIKIEEEKLVQSRIRTASVEIKAAETLNKAIANETKERTKNAKALKDEQSEYKRLSKVLNENKLISKDLLLANRELSASEKQFIKDTQELDSKLKTVDKTMGDNHRSVGGYTGAIRDALSQTGLFSGGIFRIISILRVLRREQAEAGASTSKFSTALKLGLTGLALLAANLVKDLFELSQAAVDLKDITAANLKDFANRGKTSFADLARATIAFRIELRQLQIDLQKASLDESDFNDIANDTTIGFDERNAALKESIRLGKEKAKISVTIAEKELDLVNKEITNREKALGKGAATNDLLDKRTELQLKLNAAIDDQDDLIRVNAEREREINVARATQEIDLILKKKQSANADKVILENQLADQKTLLEERRKINDELLKVNNKTTAEEIAIFKKFIKVQFDENELLAEQDAVLLKKKLESIRTLEGKGLGETAIVELAKIVKQAQENQIANGKTIIALDDEEIKRKQKIASIEREIVKLQLDDQLNDSNLVASERIKAGDRINTELEKDGNLFNRKLLKQREINFELQKADIVAQTNIKREQLKQSAESEIQAINDSVSDNKIKAEEIKKINEKLNIDLGNLYNADVIATRDATQKKLDYDKALAKQRRLALIEDIQTTSNLIAQALDARSQRTQDALDKEIDYREKSISKQEELAEKGQTNELAFQKQKLAEAELAKEQAKEKDVRRAKVVAYWNAFTEALKKDTATAAFKALAQIALADTIAGAFKDGVEKFDGNGTETSDSNIVLLSKNESVLTAKGTRENPGLATAINKGKVSEWFEENGSNLAINGRVEYSNSSAHIQELRHLNKSITQNLNKLNETVKNKKETSTHLDQLGNVIVKEVQGGITRLTTHIKARPRI